MKFFLQCTGFYVLFSALLIILDRILFDRVLAASFLYGLILGLAATLIFGWYMETRVHHSQDFTSLNNGTNQ